jgi:hypothetical protein
MRQPSVEEMKAISAKAYEAQQQKYAVAVVAPLKTEPAPQHGMVFEPQGLKNGMPNGMPIPPIPNGQQMIQALGTAVPQNMQPVQVPVPFYQQYAQPNEQMHMFPQHQVQPGLLVPRLKPQADSDRLPTYASQDLYTAPQNMLQLQPQNLWVNDNTLPHNTSRQLQPQNSAYNFPQQEQPAAPSEAFLPAFLASPAYAGTRPGYVFKMDNQGLGYYLDVASGNPHHATRKQLQYTPQSPYAPHTRMSGSSFPMQSPISQQMPSMHLPQQMQATGSPYQHQQQLISASVPQYQQAMPHQEQPAAQIARERATPYERQSGSPYHAAPQQLQYMPQSPYEPQAPMPSSAFPMQTTSSQQMPLMYPPQQLQSTGAPYQSRADNALALKSPQTPMVLQPGSFHVVQRPAPPTPQMEYQIQAQMEYQIEPQYMTRQSQNAPDLDFDVAQYAYEQQQQQSKPVSPATPPKSILKQPMSQERPQPQESQQMRRSQQMPADREYLC